MAIWQTGVATMALVCQSKWYFFGDRCDKSVRLTKTHTHTHTDQQQLHKQNQTKKNIAYMGKCMLYGEINPVC